MSGSGLLFFFEFLAFGLGLPYWVQVFPLPLVPGFLEMWPSGPLPLVFFCSWVATNPLLDGTGTSKVMSTHSEIIGMIFL